MMFYISLKAGHTRPYILSRWKNLTAVTLCSLFYAWACSKTLAMCGVAYGALDGTPVASETGG